MKNSDYFFLIANLWTIASFFKSDWTAFVMIGLAIMNMALGWLSANNNSEGRRRK